MSKHRVAFSKPHYYGPNKNIRHLPVITSQGKAGRHSFQLITADYLKRGSKIFTAWNHYVDRRDKSKKYPLALRPKALPKPQ